MATVRLAIFLLTFIYMPGEAIFFDFECDENYGQLWNQSWNEEPRSDLRCSSTCNTPDLQKMSAEDRQNTYDKCCTCNSCTVWKGHEIELFIEFASVFGRSLVVSDQAPSENDVYKIEQENSIMTEIPSNLCDWDNESGLKDIYPDVFSIIQGFMGSIVRLNFRNNQILKLPDIRCLEKLDELNLKNNHLTFISNTSFTNLTHLRTIDLSGNFIKNIDPNILTSEDLKSLFNVNFRQNELTKLDVSNMISLYPFCHVDYRNNKITELVNEANFSFNLSLTYGPGFVSLTTNPIDTFPDFEKLLNLDDITQLGHLFSFGFDFRDIPLKCDCYIEPFMEHAYEVVNVIWRDYMNITCVEPPNLANQSVVNVPPEKLICEPDIECDPHCKCIDQPSSNTSYIDCHNSGLKTLPEIPVSRFSYFVSLNVSNNDISIIGNESYLHRLSMLDISGNNLKEINNTIAKRLENASFIDLSNNPRLRQLPQMFQYHNVCSRHMEGLQISCDCKSLWIEQWVHSKLCDTSETLFQCDIPKVGIKPALEFSEGSLECVKDNSHTLAEILIAVAILILILTGIQVYFFRYELLILYLRMRQKNRNTIIPLNKYDVFLSYNDTDDSVSKWVNFTLMPNLLKAGYRVFQPCTDVAFGAERDAEIIAVLSKTRNFLTIMSESYLEEVEEGMRSWTENEWKYGWNNFKSDRSKNIVLVNFDHLSSFNVIKLQIKAFLRVGGTVDFKNHDRKIMQKIYKKLGKPLRMSMANKALDNKNRKFTQYDMFTIPCETPNAIKNIQEICNTEEIPDVFTAYQREKHNIPDTTNLNDLLKSKKRRKKNPREEDKIHKYRKCYACCHGSNTTQNLTNFPKLRQEVNMKKTNGRAIKVNGNETFQNNNEQPTNVAETEKDTNLVNKVSERNDAEKENQVQRESSADLESCDIPLYQENTVGVENNESHEVDSVVTNESNVDENILDIRKIFRQINAEDHDQIVADLDKTESYMDIYKDNSTECTNSKTSSTCDINSLSEILI